MLSDQASYAAKPRYRQDQSHWRLSKTGWMCVHALRPQPKLAAVLQPWVPHSCDGAAFYVYARVPFAAMARHSRP